MIGAVENGMLAQIKAACDAGALAYGYRSMESWPKDFDSYLMSQTVQFPACWAAFGGAHKVDRVARGAWRAHCAFGFVVAAENKRNEVSRRQGGSASEPGSYQLAMDAARILSNWRLDGVMATPLEPTSILPVETPDIPKLKQVSLYVVSFDCELVFESLPILGGISDFASFHADWDPAPFGHVAPPLPDDGPAIGVDHITLETQ